jgi:glycosyltransferase involved in cell wall biosynthesis
MIIAVNARLLLPEKIDGIGRFAGESLRRITLNHPEHHFVFIFDRKYSEEFIFSGNVRPVVCFPPTRHPLLWYGYFEMAIPHVLRRMKADLFLSPDGMLSLHASVKSLPVIHDLNFFHHPGMIPFSYRQYYRHFFPKFIHKAHRIATVSEFTKQDIANHFNFPADRIDVVHNGASKGFVPIPETEKIRWRNKYAHGSPYFLFVGMIHPRKNLANLIVAYDGFRHSTPSEVKLLIVGPRKWWTEDMQAALDHCDFRDDIIFTGRVADEELAGITAAATGLVYVSFFEGFGIPVLEAMNCDTPVICSSVTSLPEVGGDAVLYADPDNRESIRSAMIKLYTDQGLQQELIQKARLQREKFSWEKTAGLLWNSVEKCLERT